MRRKPLGFLSPKATGAPLGSEHAYHAVADLMKVMSELMSVDGQGTGTKVESVAQGRAAQNDQQ